MTDTGRDTLEALKLCQRALAMLVDPSTIKQTSLANAYAVAREAEARARSVIERESPPSQGVR